LDPISYQTSLTSGGGGVKLNPSVPVAEKGDGGHFFLYWT
jgi:hypothetical protein